MNRARVNVILLAGATDGSARRISEEKPWALVIDVTRGRMARDGVLVELRTVFCRFALALVARPGAIISVDEIVELLWGDHEDGGPDRCDLLVRQYWLSVRMALTALGYGSKAHFGRGFSAWPIERERDVEPTIGSDLIPRFLEARA